MAKIKFFKKSRFFLPESGGAFWVFLKCFGVRFVEGYIEEKSQPAWIWTFTWLFGFLLKLKNPKVLSNSELIRVIMEMKVVLKGLLVLVLCKSGRGEV